MAYNSKFTGAQIDDLLEKSKTMGATVDGLAQDVAVKEDAANKVTSITASADDIHYPSAKAVKAALTNLADGEDLASVGNVMKLADKAYNPITFSGMGRKYLRKNLVDGKNILTQAMLPSANTIYIIQYDYDLNGATITIPENCTLDFQGGSLGNGTIQGNRTRIKATQDLIFKEIQIGGSYVVDSVFPQWFGAIGNGIDADSAAIQSAVDFCAYSVIGYYGEVTGLTIKIPAGVYYIDSTITIPENAGINIIGEGHTKSILWAKTDISIIALSGNNYRGKIDGLRFANSQGKLVGCAIRIESSGNQINVVNCWMNNLKYGIYCSPSSDSNFQNNTFEYVQTPIYIGGTGSGYFDIAHNTFYNVGPISLGAGVFDPTFYIEGVTCLMLHHNRITNDVAVSVQSSLISVINSSNIVVESNIFNGTAFRAPSIKIESSANIMVKDNILPKNYKGSQIVVNATNYVYVVNNIIPTRVTGDYYGLYFKDSDFLVIDKNIIGTQGLQNLIINSTKKLECVTITNNAFEGGTVVASSATVELHNISNLLFSGNIVRTKNVNTRDVVIDTTTKAIFSSNIFSADVYIDSGTQAIVEKNFGNISYAILANNISISNNGSRDNYISSQNTNNTPYIYSRDDGNGNYIKVNCDGTLVSKVKIY